MAPPPLPLKIEVKKRKSVVDDLLSAEVDAMDKSPKVPSPPVVRQPVVRVPAPVAAPAPVIPARQPPPRLPETTGNTMSFKSRRAKTLLTILAKDPNSVLVSPMPSVMLMTVFGSGRSHQGRMSDVSGRDQASYGFRHHATQD